MSITCDSLFSRVLTSAGVVRGVSSNGIDRYLGIPYGQAVGAFGSFGELTAVTPWQEEFDGTRLPAVFPQPANRLASIMGSAIDAHPHSDQAFTVNVYAPRDAQRLPVLAFVHGGAFSTGGSGVRWYDGAPLALRANAVVVTINYRLGIWGNLAAEGVAANHAVRDVLAALTWISENIEAFGGDAANVTLAGQSAGAAIVRVLMVCDEAKGKFRRAILLSPSGRPGATADSAAQATSRVMEIAGVGDLRALAALPSGRVISASLAVARDVVPSGSSSPLFLPYMDGDFLQAWMDDPLQAAQNAHCREVMIGFTGQESAAFLWRQADEINRDASRAIAWYSEKHGDAGRLHYHRAASRRPLATPYDLLVEGASSHMFGYPALDLASAYGTVGTAYVYRFDLQTSHPHLYAPHCLDLPFFFDNVDDWHDAPMLQGLSWDVLSELATRFSRQIASYVNEGRPHDDIWRTFTDATPYVMSFDRK